MARPPACRDLGGHSAGALLLAVGDDDGRAGPRENLRDGAADAGARAGNERHLAVEPNLSVTGT